jgi:ABC-type transport system involved in cytochrome c biogenesis permease subunit
MWSLATWFVYSAYFHISARLTPKQKTAFLSLGAIMIILTLTWINLSRLFTGMHSYA